MQSAPLGAKTESWDERAVPAVARGSPPPLFSIIIPTYRRPQPLHRCLQALRRLDYPRSRFEVIVVDDGSGQALDTVTAAFREDLTVVLLIQPNAGPATARNLGASHAKGEYLAFTDDDCIPARNWLTVLADRVRSTPDQMIGGRTLNALSHNLYSSTSQAIIDVVYAYYNPDPARARFLASNNLVVPADRFRAIGGFDPTFRTSEDRDLCDRWLHRRYRMTYASDAIIYHAHALSFRSFWHQHFNYGRGARRYHTARTRRGSGKFRPEVRYYMKLLRYPFEHRRNPYPGELPIALLLALTANAAGFFAQWASQIWLRRASADPR